MKACILLLGIVLLFTATSAQAQLRSNLELQAPGERPMPTTMGWRLFGYGLAGAALATAGATAIYALTFRVADTSYDDDIGALVQATSYAGAFATVFVPLAASLSVYHAGNRRGYRGSLGQTFAGALGGFAAGSTLGAGLYFLMAWYGDLQPTAALVSSMALGTATVAAMAMRSYRRSSERKLTFAPSFGPATGARGLTLGMSGRF